MSGVHVLEDRLFARLSKGHVAPAHDSTFSCDIACAVSRAKERPADRNAAAGGTLRPITFAQLMTNHATGRFAAVFLFRWIVNEPDVPVTFVTPWT